ncbi:hypothetical protein AB0C10_16275 [Microbispora amethystogenes]|uniref:hypothetical protein n=1 Tax=Microbispora amethystogenes TaxID=1427754 RepID=UPI0033D085A8
MSEIETEMTVDPEFIADLERAETETTITAEQVDITTLRGRELSEVVLDFLQENETEWDQTAFRAFRLPGTDFDIHPAFASAAALDSAIRVYCYGGRACDLTGAQWFIDYRDGQHYLAGKPVAKADIPDLSLEWVMAEPDDNPDHVTTKAGYRVISAADRATRLLGLPENHGMFHASNSLPALRAMANGYYGHA